MGRDLLRREILKMLKLFRKERKWFAILLLAVLVTVELQAEEERPLRWLRPEGLPLEETSPIITLHSLQPIPRSSLLTPSALEQELTRYYIEQYSSTTSIANLNAVLERGNIYLPFIREEIARRNIPPELAYLPIIESAFTITARSRSGAAGLWQFMMNSISPFDIKVTELIDERRDFVKSTRGALQKLEDNYKMLGNWYLALAAYNCGLGSVTRMIQRTGIRDYWELCKRNEFKYETVHYVPRLIATAYILSQPRRFGINIWRGNFEWTAVPLRRQVSLDMLAEQADIDGDLLRRLNAELIHGITPADSGYRLKIPLSHLAQVNSVLEQEDLRLIRYYHHVVRHGDTLWSMSRHYGASLNMIETHNPGITDRYLRIGETVIIPAFGDVVPPPVPSPAVTAFNGTHVVLKGESFWSLGRRYGVDPQILAEANGMHLNQILHEGRTLKIPIID